MFDKSTIEALKQCIVGSSSREVTTEYVHDDETGEMKISKQKIIEKNIPPNIDILKMIYQHLVSSKDDYNEMTDEELEKERLRLLKELRSESVSRKCKDKS